MVHHTLSETTSNNSYTQVEDFSESDDYWNSLLIQFATIDETKLKYYFYSKEINETQFDKSNMTALILNTTKQTVFIIHGWRQTYQSKMSVSVKDAYLSSRDVNLVLVDWSVGSIGFYSLARYTVPNVGKAIGNFIQLMVEKIGLDLNRTGIIGYSLGAHVSGVAGRFLNGSTNYLIGKK